MWRMPWQFRKRKKLLRGVTLNVGKRSASLSFGRRGARAHVGTRGLGASLTALGTGLSYVSPAAAGAVAPDPAARR